jgi:hypothetical protein
MFKNQAYRVYDRSGKRAAERCWQSLSTPEALVKNT